MEDALLIACKRLDMADGASVSVSHLIDIFKDFQVTGHLAILTQPYLDRIIRRQKTIESRFSKVRVAPYQQIQTGDLVVLKESAGKILALATVGKVRFFNLRTSEEVLSVMSSFQLELALDSDFIERKKDSKFATLIEIDQVMEVTPVALIKDDRRAWVVLSAEKSRGQLTLL